LSAEERTQIIKALKANPNASAVARQIGGVSSWMVAGIAKAAKSISAVQDQKSCGATAGAHH
jgi:hypothetical protein